MSGIWTVRLGQQAEQDYLQVIHWTKTNFGNSQAKAYAETLSLTVQDLMSGPEIAGTKARDGIGPGIRTLHIARIGRKGRHFVVFRAGPEHVIDVLRILHDSMDLPRNLPANDHSSH